MRVLPKFDLVAGLGFVSSFGIYYANKEFGILDEINIPQELYNWTIGGLPEFFTGIFGVRIANGFSSSIFQNSAYRKIINSDIIPKNVRRLEEHLNSNNVLYSSLAAGSLIIGGGALDEVYDFTNGTQDLEDIVKYSLGVSTSIVYNVLRKN